MFTFDDLLQYWHTGKVEESLTTEVVHQRQWPTEAQQQLERDI